MKQLKIEFQEPNEAKPEQPTKAHGNTCNNCKFAVAYQYGAKYFWYCTKQSSRRTDNGYKKIKARNPACTLFKLVE